MENKKHKQIHVDLHRKLDELVGDFIVHTDALPSQTKLMELMTWSYEQTQNPTEIK